MVGIRLLSTVRALCAVLVAGAIVPLAVACGGTQKAASTVPRAGDMPAGGDWNGVYFNPTYGYLHLVKVGSAINGKWRNGVGDKWGEMHGQVVGDLFNFEWKETTIGMVGPSATTTGRGYFKYVQPPGENVDHEIRGEWGLGSKRTGVPWTALKQRHVRPDPSSVVPDETQKVKGSAWDEGESGGGQ
jgi:hypothetical protein